MTTERINLSKSWVLVGTGSHDLQRESSNETIYLHFGTEAPANDTTDYMRIVDNAIYPYRGSDNVYARSLDNQAFLLVTPIASASAGGDASADNQVELNNRIGATNETVAGTDTSISGLNGLLKRALQHLTNLTGLLPTSLSNGFFKVSIQETILSKGTGNVDANTQRVTLSSDGVLVTAIGNQSDAVATTSTGTFSLIALIKRLVSVFDTSTVQSATLQAGVTNWLTIDNTGDYCTCSFQLLSTAGTSLAVQASNDEGVTWETQSSYIASSSEASLASSVLVAGIYRIDITGLRKFRIGNAAYSGSSCTIKAQLSKNSRSTKAISSVGTVSAISTNVTVQPRVPFSSALLNLSAITTTTTSSIALGINSKCFKMVFNITALNNAKLVVSLEGSYDNQNWYSIYTFKNEMTATGRYVSEDIANKYLYLRCVQTFTSLGASPSITRDLSVISHEAEVTPIVAQQVYSTINFDLTGSVGSWIDVANAKTINLEAETTSFTNPAELMLEGSMDSSVPFDLLTAPLTVKLGKGAIIQASSFNARYVRPIVANAGSGTTGAKVHIIAS